MKRLVCLFVCLVCLCVSIWAFPVAAFELDTEEVPEERREEILNNLDVTLLREEIIERSIYCFAVNEEGRFAVGLDESRSRRRIQVYDSDGRYLYGYEFQCSGSFWVEFEGDNLKIFLVRSQLVVTLTSDGQCVSMREYSGSAGDMLFVTQKVCGDKIYTLERDIGFSWAFSRLAVTDTAGVRRVLYDVTWIHNAGTVCCYACVFGFALVWIYGLVRQLKKGGNEQDCHIT